MKFIHKKCVPEELHPVLHSVGQHLFSTQLFDLHSSFPSAFMSALEKLHLGNRTYDGGGVVVLVVMVLVVMVLVVVVTVVSGAGTRKQIFQPEYVELWSVLQFTWGDVSTTFDGPEVPPYFLPFTVR